MKYGTGWKRDALDHRDFAYQAKPIHDMGAEMLNLRHDMPPVYDQGSTNSCVAHSAAGAFEFIRKKQSLPGGTPSRLFIYWQARAYENAERYDEGCQIRSGIKALAHTGAPPESDWPFKSSRVNVKPDRHSFAVAEHARLVQYARINDKDRFNSILSCLTHEGPVLFGISVFPSIQSAGTDRSGYIQLPESTEPVVGGHAMLLTGYDGAARKFFLRNSWGESWGYGGYGTIDEDYVLNRDLCSDLWVTWLSSRN